MSGVLLVALIALGFIWLSWIGRPLAEPIMIASPPEIDAYAMQEGLLASVVPAALSTVVARDKEAVWVATNVAYAGKRLSAVATEVRRDSLNNVDGLSTKVARLDERVERLDNRIPTATPDPDYVAAPPAGYYQDLGS